MNTLLLFSSLGMVALLFVFLFLPFPIMIWAFINCLRNDDISWGKKIGWSLLILFAYPFGFCIYPFMYEDEGRLRTAIKIIVGGWIVLLAMGFALQSFTGFRPFSAASVSGVSNATTKNEVLLPETKLSLETINDHYQKCLKKEAESCYVLATAYADGNGVQSDRKSAAYYFKQACFQGKAEGCGHLAELMMPPFGKSSYQELGEVFVKGCLGSDNTSCENLISMTTGGRIGLAEYKEDVDSSSLHPEQWVVQVKEILEKKCDAKVGVACHGLGKLFDIGIGASRDNVKALGFYTKACDQDNWESCSKASSFYTKGDGVSPDPEKASQLASKGLDGSMAELKSLIKDK